MSQNKYLLLLLIAGLYVTVTHSIDSYQFTLDLIHNGADRSTKVLRGFHFASPFGDPFDPTFCPYQLIFQSHSEQSRCTSKT